MNYRIQLRKGVLELAVLLAVGAKERMYASDIVESLESAKFPVAEGTLYPLLTRLKGEGLLSYAWEESRQGPPRKYYSLTSLGKETLPLMRTEWQELLTTLTSLSSTYDQHR